MKFFVSTDAAADLDTDYIADNDVKVISMKYFIKDNNTANEKEYTFGNGESGLSNKEFYSKLRSGVQTKTALINTEQHKEHFIKLLRQGKDVLHVPLSSGLSGTAECAALAAEELKIAYPDQKVIVIDFKGASMGQGLFVDYMVGLRDKGQSIDEAAEWGNKNNLKFCHFFTVDDLGHLKRGGRVSGVAAFIGSLIKIKPLLHVDNEGKLIPIGKNFGRKKALLQLVEKMQLLAGKEKQRIFISHGDCAEDAGFVADKITEVLGITDIKIGFIGPIIGSHSGPGTVALFFYGEKR